MIRRPPGPTLTTTLFPSTTRFRSRRQRLHQAVADHPSREKAADLPEIPPQRSGQEHRQRDHEPDVTGAEQEHAGGRQLVDRAALGNDVAEPGLGFRFAQVTLRSEEHTSELQSLMRTSYAVFCLQKKNK